MNPQSSITIFTDGASRGNPGPGGFGAVIAVSCKLLAVREEKPNQTCVVEIGGREEHTTNNRMELRAAISAPSFLSSLKIKDKGLRIVLYSDSSYLINGITRWIHGWQKNRWQTKNKKNVENRDLWEQLLDISRNKEIRWQHIEGHVGIAGNSRADEIATAFADGKKPALYEGTLEHYPLKHILDIAHDRGLAREKRVNQTRSRAKAHSYVSMVDGRVETHQTWTECEARVKGKHARYRKVFSPDEERRLIAEWSKH